MVRQKAEGLIMVIHSLADLSLATQFTRKGRARYLRTQDLRALDIRSVARFFGLCETGTHEMVARRVKQHIWLPQYDR